MFFEDLIDRVKAQARLRIHNGELTERRLALHAGISQSHMHNVLKGARLLTPSVADQILRALRISVLDLLRDERGEIPLDLQSPAKGPRREQSLFRDADRLQRGER